MLTYLVIVPVLIGVFLYLFSSAKSAKLIALATQIVLVGLSYHLFTLTKIEEVVTLVGGYHGYMGVVLKADTLTAVFILLTTFMFLVSSIYSFNQKNSRLFWLLIFLWQSALVGIFLTRDVFNIFVLIEVVTLVIATLIMFNRDNRAMYDGIIYLMVNIVAIKFFLLGAGYLYMLTGVLDFELAGAILRENHPASAQVLPYALIMTTIALKCALLPLFSWLPKAHGTPGAPPAVSALLSGVHIKSGVYFFIRFKDLFYEAGIASSDFYLILGIITCVGGFILAMSQSDIKLILAYHTVSQVGLIITGLNMPDYVSQTGALYHVFNHAFFKGCLFLGAGLLAKAYNTRDVYSIRGVLKTYPILGVSTIMAIFGISGAPLFNGMISKYFIAYGAYGLLNWLLIFMSLGTIISFVKYSGMLFGNNAHRVVKIDLNMQIACLILGFMCLVGGVFGSQFVYFLFDVTVSIGLSGYLQKVGIFFASLVAGYLIYKYYVSTASIFKKIKGIDLSFRKICVSIGMVLVITLVVVYLRI